MSVERALLLLSRGNDETTTTNNGGAFRGREAPVNTNLVYNYDE